MKELKKSRFIRHMYGAPFSINAKMKVVIQIHYSLVHITTMKTERETVGLLYVHLILLHNLQICQLSSF